MKDFARIGVICVLLLSTVFGSAEELPHDFNAAYTAGKITSENKNTRITIEMPPALTYTCENSCVFTYNAAYVFRMSAGNSTITTSEAVEDLTKIRINRTLTGENCTIKISTDNISWTQITDATLIEYDTYYMTVTMPAKGNYYVQIGRTSGSYVLEISEITYIVSPCHCLRIVSE